VSTSPMGPILITVGIAIVVVGILVWMGGFGWFGHLPGDIRIERENVRIYVPFASMIVISIVLNLAFHLFRRFF
jgi:DUF2905 family protein